MSLANTARALPGLMRAAFLDAVAYRAEMLVWLLSTTMPLVMLSLFSAVARDAPIGRFGQREFVTYFLATFVVRQLAAAWVCWQMNFEIREGTLGMRLLRPVHPLVAYACENVAGIPMRVAMSVPIALVALWVVGSDQLSHDPAIWAVWGASMAGAWLIALFANLAIGSLAFYFESSLKLMDLWVVAFMVFSGYLIPVELFPPVARGIVEWLPFRYQSGFPVELMTGAHDRGTALLLLARQWMWVGIMATLAVVLWRRGITRFAAYGG